MEPSLPGDRSYLSVKSGQTHLSNQRKFAQPTQAKGELMRVNKLTPARATRIVRRAKLKFSTVRDRRRQGSVRYGLPGILNMVVSALASGSRTGRNIEAFVQDVSPEMRRYFGLQGDDTPSDTRIWEIIKDLGLTGFREVMVSQVKLALKRKEVTNDLFRFGVVSFDGKAGQSRSGDSSSRLFMNTGHRYRIERVHFPFLFRGHLVSSSSRVCIDQAIIPQKKGESTTFPGIFKRSVKNFPKLFKLVIADAAMLSYDNCAQVVKRNKYYLFAMKGTNTTRFKIAQRALKDQPVAASTSEKYKGRTVLRELRFIPCPDDVILPDATELWSVTRTWFRQDGTVEATEVRLFVTSIPQNERLTERERLYLVRLHWGIENNANWTLDVVFEEDTHCLCSKGSGPFVLSWLLLLAFNLVAILRARLPKEDRKPVQWHRVRKMIERALMTAEGGAVHTI